MVFGFDGVSLFLGAVIGAAIVLLLIILGGET